MMMIEDAKRRGAEGKEVGRKGREGRGGRKASCVCVKKTKRFQAYIYIYINIYTVYFLRLKRK